MFDTLCFATNNQNKIREVEPLLKGRVRLISLKDLGHQDDLAEDFLTLEENARQKAEFVFKKYGVPCFADDTGLEVDALHGEPGVLSARYAGSQKNSSDNISLLLKNLTDKSDKTARFRTVIALVAGVNNVQSFEGTVEGKIIDDLRGTDGFGYDPVFVPQGFEKTLAEMSLVEKNKISHRAKAIQKLVDYILSLD